jgi:hypothetical protein
MIDAPDLLALWERGLSRHALDRSALLCARARPELPVESIADLPLGAVNTSLLRLRAAWFGERICAHSDCEGCGGRLELTIAVQDLLGSGVDSLPHPIEAGGVRCRPPCLRDLAAVAAEPDTERAARKLLSRCVLDDAQDASDALSVLDLRAVEDALEGADPNADFALDLRCDMCGHSGVTLLDIGELLWDEVDARARALLTDVHVLARAYGWTERETLSLGNERRAAYLSMVAP